MSTCSSIPVSFTSLSARYLALSVPSCSSHWMCLPTLCPVVRNMEYEYWLSLLHCNPAGATSHLNPPCRPASTSEASSNCICDPSLGPAPHPSKLTAASHPEMTPPGSPSMARSKPAPCKHDTVASSCLLAS